MSTPEELGSMVVKRRLDLGMTQAQLATAAKLSVSGLQNIESGEATPKISTLANLVEALQWTPQSVGRLQRGQAPEAMGTPPVTPELRALQRIASALERIANVMELSPAPTTPTLGTSSRKPR